MFWRESEMWNTVLMAPYNYVCFHCWKQIITEAIFPTVRLRAAPPPDEYSPQAYRGWTCVPLLYQAAWQYTVACRPIGVTREKGSGGASRTWLYFWHPSDVYSEGMTWNGQAELEPQKSNSSCGSVKTHLWISETLWKHTQIPREGRSARHDSICVSWGRSTST